MNARATAKVGADDFIASGLGAAELGALPRLELGDEGYPVLTQLSEVAAEEVEWVWPGRIPARKFSLIIGEPGAGKGFVMSDMTARLTRGIPWPDGSPCPSAAAITLSSEDGLADTLRPRIDQAGGDASRVHVLRTVRRAEGEAAFSLERDLPALERAFELTRAAIAWVDPISAYLGERNSYKDSEIRGILTPLAALAERRRAAVVGVLHLTKDAQRRFLNRAQGSIAFVAQARVVLAVGEDPQVSGRRLLVAIKSNVGPLPPALAFRISNTGLAWETGTVEGSADRLLAGDEVSSRSDRRALEAAEQFLRDTLREGAVSSKEIMNDATSNGIAQRTLWRAKDELGVVAEQSAHVGRRAWFWRLPEAG